MSDSLTHFDQDGRAHMVDIAEKSETKRIARASGRILMQAATLQIISSGTASRHGLALVSAAPVAVTPLPVWACRPGTPPRWRSASARFKASRM